MIPFYVPPYSSHLNPVERMWAQLKNHWMKYVAEREGIFLSEDHKADVESVITTKVRSSRNLWKAAYRDYLKVLKGL